MDCLAEIGRLQQQKIELFSQYEALTAQMLDALPQALAQGMAQREALRGRIDRADGQMGRLACQLPDGQLLLQALRLACARSQVPPAYLPFFDSAQEVFAIANRIRRLEGQLALHLTRQRAQVLEQIRAHNRSVGARAARFGAGRPGNGAAGVLLGGRYHKA